LSLGLKKYKAGRKSQNGRIKSSKNQNEGRGGKKGPEKKVKTYILGGIVGHGGEKKTRNQQVHGQRGWERKLQGILTSLLVRGKKERGLIVVVDEKWELQE